MPAEVDQKRPNIILIMVDDMGFSDIDCYGSEVSTPNLSRMAEDRTELNDLSHAKDDEVRRLDGLWCEWADRVGVVPREQVIATWQK